MPTDDEIRQWANDSELGGAMLRITKEQDWIHFIANHERGRLLLEIADSDAQQRDIFLRCLYQLSWDSVNGSEQERTYLGYLLHRVSTWSSKSDVVEWTEKSTALLMREREYNNSTNEAGEFEDMESWLYG